MEILRPPGAAAEVSVRTLAARPRTLRDRRVAVLDNAKPNADALLNSLADGLVRQAGVASVRRWRKPSASRPADNLEEIAAAADVVVTGSAD
jgi:hypothetical protein